MAGTEKRARVNHTHPLIVEIDGERHTIGEAQVNADGTFDCTTTMLEYRGRFSGHVRGFYLDPTVDLSDQNEEEG